MKLKTSINLGQSIESLNIMHAKLKSAPSDLTILDQIKIELDSFQYVHKPQPIEISFGLALKDEDYIDSYRKYRNFELLKFHATREGNFDDAAKFKAQAKKEIVTALHTLLKKRLKQKGPFYLFNERVLYYQIGSKVRGFL